MIKQLIIAYFSMEIGLESKMPTYSGGFGVLAGGTFRVAADLKVSMVDGWWIEGHIEGVTGWSIGDSEMETGKDRGSYLDVLSLCDKLEKAVLPMYYQSRNQYIEMMRYGSTSI